jgi:hypothetical protein
LVTGEYQNVMDISIYEHQLFKQITVLNLSNISVKIGNAVVKQTFFGTQMTQIVRICADFFINASSSLSANIF